jgi:phosphatidylserine/phosphatidylglycerophosphate/cardiolipin synthase-like enzyme
MWYSQAANHDSPGAVIAGAVADLYARVRANPEQYPRGMTVRIMLGNPPELASGEATGQLWTLLDDLRYAGVDKMVDEAIGWKLEVADFEGNLPHSHVKTLVIDGKTAAANGFNMTYDHLPEEHPSGLGGGRFDFGLLMTGPVAQSTQRMFDDMWNGADQRYCLSFDPPWGIPWQATCYDKSAEVSHVPEVQKFYLPGGDSAAFSMYRSQVHDQADQQTVALIRAAQESLDAVHVNFALDMICNLNILFNVCTVDFAPEYMDALIQAAQNGAQVRLLVKPGPAEGIENNVALDALDTRLQELGIADRVEVRYFDGPVHAKGVLVDNQVLIVGSQNFHYSAYGEGAGLTEYGLAVEDQQAVEAFKDAFAYEWQRTGG